MIDKIFKLWFEWKRARALRNIRSVFAFLGRPLDIFSDDEIEAGVSEFARQFERAGITARQFNIAITETLGRAMIESERALMNIEVHFKNKYKV